jgi:hypothetical protein
LDEVRIDDFAQDWQVFLERKEEDFFAEDSVEIGEEFFLLL